MKYTDVKLDQVFVEVVDREKHPKREPRKIVVVSTSIYSANVRVTAGRGVGGELCLPLKRITDSAQWVLG